MGYIPKSSHHSQPLSQSTMKSNEAIELALLLNQFNSSKQTGEAEYINYRQKVVTTMQSLQETIGKYLGDFAKKPHADQQIQYLFGALSKQKDFIQTGCDNKNENNRVKYKLQCIYEYLSWFIGKLQHMENSDENPEHLLTYFISDFLDDSDVENNVPEFSGLKARPRCKIEHSRFLYEDAKKLCFYGYTHSATTSEVFGIMGLRQSIEAKFNRLIGLVEVCPVAKFSHSFIVDIVLQNWHTGMFPNKVITKQFLSNVKIIVDWTNTIVHWSHSTPVWLLWKAFEYVNPLFEELAPPCHDNRELMTILSAPGTKRLNSTIRLTVAELNHLRDLFVEKIVEKYSAVKSIQWEKPEATILGSQELLEATIDVEQWKMRHLPSNEQ